jgi:hypothetical protein
MMVVLAATTANASHAPQINAGGMFLVPDVLAIAQAPGGSLGGLLFPCNPASPLNGLLFGKFVDVTGYAGHGVVITPDATLDVDGYFYTAACAPTGGNCAAGFLGAIETCTVPATAKYLYMFDFLGLGNYGATVG